MSDYIKREDAIKHLTEHLPIVFATGLEPSTRTAERLLGGVPSADVVERDWADEHWNPDEWCHDCKEYDKENHRCPRWNKVIRQTVSEAIPVRCSECEHKETYTSADRTEPYLWCRKHGKETEPWDFCSWGERSE